MSRNFGLILVQTFLWKLSGVTQVLESMQVFIYTDTVEEKKYVGLAKGWTVLRSMSGGCMRVSLHQNPPRLAVGPTQPPVTGSGVLYWWYIGRSVTLTTHFRSKANVGTEQTYMLSLFLCFRGRLHGELPLYLHTWCVQVLRSPKEAFAAAMQSWRERCEKFVCLQGDYVEK